MMIETHSAEETFEAGRKMGLEARPGTIICLNGDLGTGKTVFTKRSSGWARDNGAGGKPYIYSCTDIRRGTPSLIPFRRIQD